MLATSILASSGFVLTPPGAAAPQVARSSPMMMAKKGPAPKGPFGGSTDTDEGWIGDQSESDQVKAFEAATDYLF